MAAPYSCLVAFSSNVNGKNEQVLVGTAGSQLIAQSSSGAKIVWPKEVDATGGTEEEDEPPGKRVKLSPREEVANFSCLALTNDKKYIIAVTAEDKAIRVFQIGADFQLDQLSSRCMPRRPCEIAITSDDSTILCADKFGDVYSLPLIPGPDEEAEIAKEEAEETPYVPAATVLTVHSGHNRKVLEEQLKQKAKGPKKSKDAPRFKHDLLLGHVSMLTDIACTTVGGRNYIITADRDEHIRISRGLPQAHIIEGFCHGHEAFVNRLCFTRSGLLVSGGGDPELFAWKWLEGQLVQKLSIRDAVYQFLKSQPSSAPSLPENQESFRVAVSGLWSVPNTQSEDEILVACEGVPALFSFTVGASPMAHHTVPLRGNALDVTLVSSENACTATVSVDSLHTPGSTTEVRKDEDLFRLQFFSYRQDGQWEEDAAAGQAFEWISRNAGTADKGRYDEKAIRDIIYGAENLRKRPGHED